MAGLTTAKQSATSKIFFMALPLQWNTLVLVQKKMSASIGDAPTMVPGTHAAPG